MVSHHGKAQINVWRHGSLMKACLCFSERRKRKNRRRERWRGKRKKKKLYNVYCPSPEILNQSSFCSHPTPVTKCPIKILFTAGMSGRSRKNVCPNLLG